MALIGKVADGISIDFHEVSRLRERIYAICVASWGPEATGTSPDAWAFRDGYMLQHFELSIKLLEAVQDEQSSHLACHQAVDSASLAFAIFHLWAQGCRASNEAAAYIEGRQNTFHMMARSVFKAITTRGVDLTPEDLTSIVLNTTIVALPVSLLKKARVAFAPPEPETAWLREIGRYSE